MTELRNRMDEAMVLRGFSPRTRESYLACVRALAKHYWQPPDVLDGPRIQAYLLHLITERKLAYASVNQASCAFRFLFGTVLRKPEMRLDIPMAKVPKRLPQILSRAEVSRLIEAAATLRGRTLLTITYAAGLRVSELCALQLTDIESAPDRMCLKVRQGKGGPTGTTFNHTRSVGEALTPDGKNSFLCHHRGSSRSAFPSALGLADTLPSH